MVNFFNTKRNKIFLFFLVVTFFRLYTSHQEDVSLDFPDCSGLELRLENFKIVAETEADFRNVKVDGVSYQKCNNLNLSLLNKREGKHDPIFSYNIIKDTFKKSKEYLDQMRDDRWIYSDKIKERVERRTNEDYPKKGISKKIDQVNIVQDNWFLTKLNVDDDENTPLYEQFMLVKPETKVVVLGGDLHGDIHSLVSMIRPYINQDYTIKSDYENYLFIAIGDYVDGFYSIEVLTLLMYLKLKNKHNVITLRGNHETIKMNQNNFDEEIERKYPNTLDELKNYLKYVYATMPSKLWLGPQRKSKKSIFRFVPFLRHLKKYKTKDEKVNWYCFLHATFGENENVLKAFNEVSNKNRCMESFYKVVGDANNEVVIDDKNNKLYADADNNVLRCAWGYIDQFMRFEDQERNVGFETMQQEVFNITDQSNKIVGIFSGHQHSDYMSLDRPRDIAFAKKGFYNFWEIFYILSPSKTVQPLQDINNQYYYGVNPENYNILEISLDSQKVTPVKVEYRESYKEKYREAIDKLIYGKNIQYIDEHYKPEAYQPREGEDYQKDANQPSNGKSIGVIEFQENITRKIEIEIEIEIEEERKYSRFLPDFLFTGSLLLFIIACKYQYL